MTMANPRYIAVEALLRVTLGEGYSNLVLDAALERAGLSGRDAAFVSALFYGTLERQTTLDAILARFQTAGKKTSPFVTQVLRTGAYQILYLDRVPDAAAVHEAVELVRHSREARAAGFVNAVLRRVAQAGKDLIQFSTDTPEDLSVAYSCPLWLVQNLLADYGRALTQGYLAACLEPAPVYLRVNTQKTTAAALQKELTALGLEPQETLLETALALPKLGNLLQTSLYTDGLFFVEDLASQLSVEVLDPRPGERMLDLCAAPGGKSFAAALRMENTGTVVSCDLHRARVALIAEGRNRLGLTAVAPTVNDATAGAPDGSFQKVLCDVPCSGFGIIRRKPDIKYKNPDTLKGLPALQLQILERGAAAVAPGGVLQYSTCTLRRSENQKIVFRFLTAHPEFSLDPIALPGVKSAVEDGMLTMMPQLGGTDGFFVARLRRK